MIRIATVLLVMVPGTACSSTQPVYRNADWQLEYYAWKTVNTSSAQRHDWQPLLQQTLQQHREQELPLVIAWLDLAARLVGTSNAAGGAECLADNALVLYRRQDLSGRGDLNRNRQANDFLKVWSKFSWILQGDCTFHAGQSIWPKLIVWATQGKAPREVVREFQSVHSTL